METSKKEIFAIFQQSRVMGTEEHWGAPNFMWCDENEEDAKKDTEFGRIRNDGYLEFRYYYERVNLYLHY